MLIGHRGGSGDRGDAAKGENAQRGDGYGGENGANERGF